MISNIFWKELLKMYSRGFKLKYKLGFINGCKLIVFGDFTNK